VASRPFRRYCAFDCGCLDGHPMTDDENQAAGAGRDVDPYFAGSAAAGSVGAAGVVSDGLSTGGASTGAAPVELSISVFCCSCSLVEVTHRQELWLDHSWLAWLAH